MAECFSFWTAFVLVASSHGPFVLMSNHKEFPCYGFFVFNCLNEKPKKVQGLSSHFLHSIENCRISLYLLENVEVWYFHISTICKMSLCKIRQNQIICKNLAYVIYVEMLDFLFYHSKYKKVSYSWYWNIMLFFNAIPYFSLELVWLKVALVWTHVHATALSHFISLADWENSPQ